MSQAWWKKSVVYQVYPRSFRDSNGDGIGDLKGITSKLDYIKELGADVIWLSPIYQSPNDDNGYDISDYRAIMKEFGTMEDFDQLLAEAHRRGLKIVMDLVVNHTSDEHPWFVESRSSRDNPKRDYYIWREPRDGKEPNNWGNCFSGSAWEYDPQTEMYYLHCFSKKQPDLNWENPQVRQEVYDLMTWWCEKGIDGFRMDVISMISKKPGLPDTDSKGAKYGSCLPGTCHGPHVHEYLQEMNRKVLSRYDLMTVGETAAVTVEEAKKYANAQGTELNMVFQFEHNDLDTRVGPVGKWCLDRMDLVKLKEILSRWQTELDGKAWNSLYFCNHDQPRIVSRLGDDSPQYRERSAKCIATCVHMMQGTPYVYQGEELGMTNAPFTSLSDYRDIDAIRGYHDMVEGGILSPEEMLTAMAFKSRDNARTPMQWDDSPNAGFTTGTPWIMVNPNYKEINAREQMARPDSVFHYYKALIALRRSSPLSDLLMNGHYTLLLPQDPELFVYLREYEGQKLLVACNLSGSTRKLEGLPQENWKLVLTNAPVEKDTLLPWQACVFKNF